MIIGISGKIGSGKDLTGQIIQALVNKPDVFDKMEGITVPEIEYKVWDKPKFENKKFADTLKDMICILLSCTREQLEDRDFKESPLSENWWYYKLGDGTILPRGYYPNEEDNQMCEKRYLVKTTPRLLLQLMGTECGRDILHPNVWVNAVFLKYRPYSQDANHSDENHFPNWVITDMRFPNELEAIKKRSGITIRVNRDKVGPSKMIIMDISTEDRSKDIILEEKEHPSETSLDNADFDHTIENNGTIKDLVDKIKEILILEKII